MYKYLEFTSIQVGKKVYNYLYIVTCYHEFIFTQKETILRKMCFR